MLHIPGQRARELNPGEIPPETAWLRPDSAGPGLLGVLLAHPELSRIHLRDPDPELLPLLGTTSLRALRIEGQLPAEAMAQLTLPGTLEELILRDQALRTLEPLVGTQLRRLVLSGTPISHTALAPLAKLPLEHLDLSRTPLIDFHALRAALQVRSAHDLAARMALSEAWEDVIEFKFEEGFGEFWVDQEGPASDEAPIPLGDAQQPLPGSRPDWARWQVLRTSADVFGLDLGALVGPMPGLMALAGLPLKRLDLSDTPVADLSFLAGMTGLRTLGLGQTGVVELAALRGLTELQALDLSSAPVASLMELGALSSLKALRLSDQHLDLPQARSLLQCTQLSSLALHNATFSDGALGVLGALPALRQLSLHGGDLIATDLAGLAQAKGLEDLDLTRCSLADQAPALATFTQLKRLSLRKSSLNDAQLVHLEGLKNLEHLALSFCRATQGPAEALAEALSATEVILAFEE
jgi:Leucine-rich repeat (LRR) protein